jgi:tripeptidyl-peptidase II
MTSPWTGLVPKSDTQADVFLSARPRCNGAGVVVAILDTGVDPGAIGMQRTPDGRPKVLDLVDATGAGDIDTSSRATTISPACVKGLSGRALHLGAWDNPSGEYKLGLAKGYTLFPKSLVKRLQRERKARWALQQRQAINALEVELSALRKATTTRDNNNNNDNQGSKDASSAPTKTSHKDALADATLRLAQLRDACGAASPDEGPVYDVVVFRDGSGTWRAALDLAQMGDLRGATLFTNFRAERQYGTFEEHDGLMNFAVNIYNDGDLVSIYCDTGAHGSHVAGIVAGHHPGQPELDGVAPGAQIVGIKIGDTRLGSMETGPGLERGLLAVLENGCDVINMSYGEPTKTPNKGRFSEFARLVVEEHGVVFVASAGNAGPALSTAGAPGGTTSSLIAVGAFVSPHMMRDEYAMRDGSGNVEAAGTPPQAQIGEGGKRQQESSAGRTLPPRNTLEGLPPGVQYTWSSRGPAFDGDYGPNVSAPGGAIASVPNWTLQRNQLMNGTSMSSPNCAGNVALLLSALKQPEYARAGVVVTPHLIKRALENTAKKVPGHTFHDIGHGIIQTEAAFQWILRQNLVERSPELRSFSCTCNRNGQKRRGLYLRDACDVARGPLVVRISVCPEFRDALTAHNNRDRVDFQLRAVLSTTARWIQAPDRTLIMHGGRGFDIRVDPTGLSPGLHTAEVWGRDQNAADSAGGPLFRFPVTVVVPEPAAEPAVAVRSSAGASTVSLGEHVWSMNLAPGQITRQFLTVPHGAAWIDVAVTGGNTYGGGDNGTNPRLYALHLQQVSDDDAQ